MEPKPAPLLRSLADAMPRGEIARFAALWAAVWGAIAVLCWDFSRTPYYWDGVGYVLPHSKEIWGRWMFPFLQSWDVGHPSLFYWLNAAAYSIVRNWALSGHLVVWGFSALFVCGVFGALRLLGVPRIPCAAAAIAFLAHPLVYAQSQQIVLDLPQAALFLAATYFWARGRWVPYAILAGAGALVKLYGFLLAPALAGASLLAGIAERKPAKSIALDILRCMVPIAVFGAFHAGRVAVRGPGLSHNWTTGNQPVPLWDWPAFATYFQKAWTEVFQSSRVELQLLALVALLAALLVAPRARAEFAEALRHPQRGRFLVGSAFLCGGLMFAFFQMRSLCGRYNLPTLAFFAIAEAWLLHLLVRRAWITTGALCLLAAFHTMLWHPDRLPPLPAPVREFIYPETLRAPYRFENDLRFADVAELVAWGVERIEEDSRARGAEPKITSNWFFWIAASDKDMGYSPYNYYTRMAARWADIPDAAFPYVLIVRPVSDFADPHPPRFKIDHFDVRQLGEARAELFYIEMAE